MYIAYFHFHGLYCPRYTLWSYISCLLLFVERYYRFFYTFIIVLFLYIHFLVHWYHCFLVPFVNSGVFSPSLHTFWTAASETPVSVHICLSECPSLRSLRMLFCLISGSLGLPPRFPPVLLLWSTDSCVLSRIICLSQSPSPHRRPTTSGAIFPSDRVLSSPSSVRT